MVDPATALAAYEAAKKIIEAAGVAKTAVSKFDTWYKNGASEEDQKKVVGYCKQLDERRVFYVNDADETIGAILWSLNEVRQVTLAAMSEVTHPVADAAFGGALDSIRKFLDEWHGFRAEHHQNLSDPGARPYLDREHRFFTALGELRTKFQTYVILFATIAPKAKAPNLFKAFSEQGS